MHLESETGDGGAVHPFTLVAEQVEQGRQHVGGTELAGSPSIRVGQLVLGMLAVIRVSACGTYRLQVAPTARIGGAQLAVRPLSAAFAVA